MAWSAPPRRPLPLAPVALEHVLVAVDGGPGSADALAFAAAVAGAHEASATAVSVYGSEAHLGRGGSAYAVVAREDAERAASEAVAALAEVSGAETRVERGDDPALTIARSAQECGAGLVVVGSSEEARHGRNAPGRLALRLLHGAPVPVAIVPRGWTDGDVAIRSVGLAYRASVEADAAAAFAVGVALHSGATLRVWHVVERSAVADAALWAAAHVTVREWAQEELDHLRRRLPDELDARLEVLDGHTADAIGEASGDVDVLVVGSRGYGPLGRTLISGVSAAIIRRVSCPVVVVPRAVPVPEG